MPTPLTRSNQLKDEKMTDGRPVFGKAPTGTDRKEQHEKSDQVMGLTTIEQG
jgi:hypothetical protein